jgi:SAM-dependent methyltransferase
MADHRDGANAVRLPNSEELLEAARSAPPDLVGRTLLAAVLVRTLGNGSVLDVGCKSGWLLQHLALQGPARRLIGVDVDPSWFPTLARGGAPAFVAADARRLPFPEGSFDVVALLDVIEHVPTGSERCVLLKAARVLAPGGTLVLTTPSTWLLGTILDPAFWLTGHRHYSRERILSLVRSAGLTPRAAATRGGWAPIVGLPVFYAGSRVGGSFPGHDRLGREATRQYGRPGRYTLIVVTRKAGPDGAETLDVGPRLINGAGGYDSSAAAPDGRHMVVEAVPVGRAG